MKVISRNNQFSEESVNYTWNSAQGVEEDFKEDSREELLSNSAHHMTEKWSSL